MRGPEWVRARLFEICDLLGVETAHEAAQAMKQKINKVGLETDFSKLGIESDADIEIIIKNGFDPARIRNNPRKVDRKFWGELIR